LQRERQSKPEQQGEMCNFCFVSYSMPQHTVLLEAASKTVSRGKTSKGRNKGQLVKRIWKSGISEEILRSREVENIKMSPLPDFKCIKGT
jgi:hypothetical protein